MAPIDTVEGVKARLKNLGLYAGPVDGAPDDELTDAIGTFQRSQGMPVTGTLDAPLRDALVAAHGS
jgi:peptidoglycan hydrolase-like protein with peptidoglycan-binding domain